MSGVEAPEEGFSCTKSIADSFIGSVECGICCIVWSLMSIFFLFITALFQGVAFYNKLDTELLSEAEMKHVMYSCFGAIALYLACIACYGARFVVGFVKKKRAGGGGYEFI